MENIKRGKSGYQREIAVATSNRAAFDDAFLAMKEHFDSEMKKMDMEITRFNTNLMKLYGVPPTDRSPSSTQSMRLQVSNEMDVLNNTPLVEGEGENRKLKLQFDLTQFDPAEVKVTIVDDILVVEATHVEKTSSVTIYREFAREVQLPKGLDPDAVFSNLSRDGVLTVQASLSNPKNVRDDEESEVLLRSIGV
ncbi:protein lethal(2)essential for life-like [Battus philenor]|uniref:protein lethal(2)essential for life-like n=1 Tax=Battus philenor TaxID=42288 RepID=UPI0035CFAB4B